MNRIKSLFSFFSLCMFASLSMADCSEVKTKYADGSYSFRSTSATTSPLRPCGCQVKVLLRKPDPNKNFDWGDWATFTSPVDIWDRFPKTQIVLDRVFKSTNQCPDEANFQVLVSTWRNEVEEKNEEEMKSMKQYAQENAAKSAQIQRMCQGIPKVNIESIERLSSSMKVHPDSIKIARLEFGSGSTICRGIFYTPNGAKTCELEFDSGGVVKSLQRCN
jgi:hypothetical protein